MERVPTGIADKTAIVRIAAQTIMLALKVVFSGAMQTAVRGCRQTRLLAAIVLCAAGVASIALGGATQPIVAIHDSEQTRALALMPLTNGPTGAGTTNKQWWTTDWHYFVMPESVKEALRSDGTPFTVVGDSNIMAGVLLTNDAPRYPILISLASEAIQDEEISALTNYVAKGGFLLVGSSAFTRTTDGTSRGDFAFADALGLHMVRAGLTNWGSNNTLTKASQADHVLISHFPAGPLTNRLPSFSEEISWGITPSHPFLAAHDIWQVQASGATVLASGDNYPLLCVKQYGKGYFIYHAAFQPLIGHGSFAPGMYSYLFFRRAIEWAFGLANLPIPKLSPWPYMYDAAFMVRHDLENYSDAIRRIETSALTEFTNGARGDYYFCTGTVREDVSSATRNNIIAGLRRSVTNYGATIGPHNGGLKNPNDPNLTKADFQYWHWGPDEALDVTPAGYPSGKTYALTSISNAFTDVEAWLSGTSNGGGFRPWVACYFNATREDSYDIQEQLGVKINSEQKLTPFPHWTVSTRTPGRRYSHLSQPVSDWYVGGLVAQSLEPWHWPGIHTSATMHEAIDFYYQLGALINIYSHTLTLTNGGGGSAGTLVFDYVTYGLNRDLHPRVWSANATDVYQWWLQRSHAQTSVSFATNGSQSLISVSIANASDTNTAIEILVPTTNSFCGLSVKANGLPAPTDSYRINNQVIKLRVGTTVTNAVIGYYPLAPGTQVFSENFDDVKGPDLPADWTTSANGALSPWETRNRNYDTAPNAAFAAGAASIGLTELVSPPIALPVGTAQLTFQNNYDLERGTNYGYDGGVLEIKLGTNDFTDILAAGGSFLRGGYNCILASDRGNPLEGRVAWSGDSAGFIPTVVNLPAAAGGQTIQLKWRCGTDDDGTKSGWRIDTVAITNRACSCSGDETTNTAPVIETISLVDGGLVMSWSTVSGQTYRVHYTDSLQSPAWHDAPPDVLATGPTATVTNAIGNSLQRFYRVFLVR